MKGSRILVVEDESILAHDISQLLEQFGYVVDGIESTAAGAIQRVDESEPDLILMDVRLKGGIDGIDAAHAIQENHDIPIIYLTAYADPDTLERAKITQPFGYILKPFDDRELHTVIEMGLYKHQMERDIRDSEARHRSLIQDVINVSKLGVLILDKQRKVVWINQALEAYFGLHRDDIVGQASETFVQKIKPMFENNGAADADLLANRGESASAEHFECRVPASLERRGLWLEHWSQPIHSGFYQGGRVEYYHDITDRKLAEKALQESEATLRQSQKMESVGTLAGGVAHDFNNILTTILTNAELALESIAPDAPEFLELSEIRRAAVRACGLTSQLLGFSRRQVLQRRPLDINKLIADLLKMLLRLLGEDVELKSHLAPNLAPVIADPGQIQQVLMNLCANARDALPNGGSVTIKTQEVNFRPVENEDGEANGSAQHFVQITVEDSGSGMSEDTLAHVFEPFFTTKEVGKGTGLGLATAYGIVKQHGGNIDVNSKPGAGTAITILLPSKPDLTIEPEEDVATKGVPGHNETILIVEDEPAVRNVAIRMLNSLSYKTLTAEDGDEALNIFKSDKGRIDLVVTDVVMPKLSGLELYKELKKIKPDIRVLFVTGYAPESRIPASALADDGGVGLLQKPYTRATLTQKIQEVLRR